MLEGFWYIAAESSRIRPGRLVSATLLNQPLVLFRDQSRMLCALEDRCPHRGVPLSAGWHEGDSIRCRYHGWRFDSLGSCAEVPSLADGPPPTSICARSYPVQEQDGWAWVYIGQDSSAKPTSGPPLLPLPPTASRLSTARASVCVNARMDFVVDSLVDPAHVPFVHNRFFRQKRVAKLKEKEFTRLPLGFRTVSENTQLPNTFVFRILGAGAKQATTSVDFFLPGIHLETLQVGQRFGSIMLIATPLTPETTRLDITVGWNFLQWSAPLSKLLVRLTARTTLGQDRAILELQERGNRQTSTMNVGMEMDTLAVWYRRLKKYYLNQQAGVANLEHPVPERTTLRWVT